MPCQWLPATDDAAHLHLWPHRSLPRRGFVGFFGLTAALGAVPLVGTFGAPMGAFASFVFFLGVLFYSLRYGKEITVNNYWNPYADTLEWTLPCPPPEHTFEQLPKQSDWDHAIAH